MARRKDTETVRDVLQGAVREHLASNDRPLTDEEYHQALLHVRDGCVAIYLRALKDNRFTSVGAASTILNQTEKALDRLEAKQAAMRENEVMGASKESGGIFTFQRPELKSA